MKKNYKIDILTLAYLQALLTGLLGLLAGILYSFGGLIFDILVSLEWITSSETPGLSYGTALAFGALVGMPAIFALIGFLAGVIEGILFNTIGKLFKGIKLDLQKQAPNS